MKKIFLLALAILFIGISQANASLVVGNLDQEDSVFFNEGFYIGQAFTTGSAITIDSVTFRVDYEPYHTYDLRITYANPDGTIFYGNVLDVWTCYDQSARYIKFVGTYTLEANTTYWLLLENTVASTVYARVANSDSYTSNYGASLPSIYNNYGLDNGYYPLDQHPLLFEVTGTVVPIPGAVLLFGSGLIGIIGFRRQFK